MQLFVKSADLHTLDVAGSETVADIRQQVAALDGLSAPDIAMYCRGRPLEDHELVSMFAEQQCTLDVEVRLLGGELLGCPLVLEQLTEGNVHMCFSSRSG